MNRRADTLVRRTAAQVASHRAIDVGIGRLLLAAQQTHRAHHLAALAVAALRNVVLDPSVEHSLADLVIGNVFRRGDLLTRHRGDRQHTTTRGLAVQVHRARTARRNAATEFRRERPGAAPKRFLSERSLENDTKKWFFFTKKNQKNEFFFGKKNQKLNLKELFQILLVVILSIILFLFLRK